MSFKCSLRGGLFSLTNKQPKTKITRKEDWDKRPKQELSWSVSSEKRTKSHGLIISGGWNPSALQAFSVAPVDQPLSFYLKQEVNYYALS